MLSDFDKAFKNGQSFDNIKLTKNHPCSKCKYEKELEQIDKLGIWSDEEAKKKVKLLNECRQCEAKLTYIKNCYDKLKEYESIDISTEHLRKIKEFRRD